MVDGSAPVSAWSLQEGTGEGNELSVFKNGDPVGKITIDDTPGVRLTVSDYVFCPGPIPLLVVASESQDHEPKLYVYNLENLQRVRELLAHSNRILDLAISGDGQFLVSTAADSTVRVWRLNDVRQSLGRRGQIRNGDHLLSVAVIDGALRVMKNLDDLLKGDVIVGLEGNGQDQGLPKSAQSFNLFVRSQLPGSLLTLRVKRGETITAVPRKVGEGINFRGPLFSLYFSREREDANWEWIGWHPLGQFESSGPAVEENIGWHFNTWDQQAPVRFADLGQYRENYYTPGLLKSLIETGTIPPRTRPRLPRLSLHFQQKDGSLRPRETETGQIVVRDPDDLTNIAVELTGGDPQVAVNSVAWKLSSEGAPLSMARLFARRQTKPSGRSTPRTGPGLAAFGGSRRRSRRMKFLLATILRS